MPKKSNQETFPIEPFVGNAKMIKSELPPYSKYERNEAGLINGIDYKFNEDNSVNWKQMINPKFIVLNKEKKAEIEKKYNRNLDELQLDIQEKKIDVEDIDDKYKLILLAGFKEIAKLRGYYLVDYYNFVTSPEYVATKCTINWIPNFETGKTSITFSSLADAHQNSVKGYFANFLNCAAENRAFVRAVRNFLNIHLVGNDELGNASLIEETSTVSNISPSSPRAPLNMKFDELNKEYKIPFSSLMKYVVEKKNPDGVFDDAVNWTKCDDIPEDKVYDILGIFKEQLEKQKAKRQNNE